jgi:signal transduction histidine kinase
MQSTALKDREAERLLEAMRRGESKPVQSNRSPAAGDSGELAPLDVPHADYTHELECQMQALSRSEQQARMEAQSLRDAHQSRERSLAMLVHEMRMPLQPVLTVAAALLRDPRVPADLLDDVRTIQRNVQLEARLIDDLLDLSRGATGKLAIERSSVNLHSIIKRALEICRPDAAEKHLDLSARLNAVRSWVNGDPGRLQQVIWNLLRNAVKFTPPGGRIVIETLDAPDGRIIVRVSDSGAGIPADALGSIFEPFNQIGQKMNRQNEGARHDGLGLGLAVCKLLVERHDGAISAASEGPGQGATFTIKLGTIDPPPSAAPSRGSIPANPMRRLLRVLLVEDDQSTCTIMARLLRTTGHTVHMAFNCAETMALVQNEEVDLLLCDLGLPDGNGLDLLAKIRQSGRTMRAIALTGFSAEDDEHNTRAAGFDAHLTKPITLEQLAEQINRIFP